MMQIELARENMIHQQLKAWEVSDEEILNLYHQVHREAFVPKALRNFAFADFMLPIGHDQTMLEPKQEARILQALKIQPNETVLEVGTGTGFFTTLLAMQAKQVISIDIFADFTEHAKIHLREYEVDNTTCLTGDAAHGWVSAAPYDVMVFTGSLPELSTDIKMQLAVGGRLFAIVGDAPMMPAFLLTRLGEKKWKTELLFETMVIRLLHARAHETFKF